MLKNYNKEEAKGLTSDEFIKKRCKRLAEREGSGKGLNRIKLFEKLKGISNEIKKIEPLRNNNFDCQDFKPLERSNFWQKDVGENTLNDSEDSGEAEELSQESDY